MMDLPENLTWTAKNTEQATAMPLAAFIGYIVIRVPAARVTDSGPAAAVVMTVIVFSSAATTSLDEATILMLVAAAAAAPLVAIAAPTAIA